MKTEEATSKGKTKSSTSDVVKRKNKKRKLIRPRGKRGGVKNRKPSEKSTKNPKNEKNAKGKEQKSTPNSTSIEEPSPSTSQTAHSVRIAKYHSLEKELYAPGTSDERRAAILLEQESMGGIDAYQDDSVFGGDKQRGGESGKWLVAALEDVRGVKKENLKLLDVGALTGTSYASYPWLDVTSIDINPRADHVIKSDFFEFPTEEQFDVVSLSLVVNFIGDLRKRGEALIHAHDYLSPKGYLYLVLPLACVQSSRYLTHDRLKEILLSTGWEVRKQDDSTKLTRWLCQRRAGGKAQWDGKLWKKEEVKVAVKANNFCIRVG